MTLEDLRHREDAVREDLAAVREKLDAVVAVIERAERAREQAAAHGGRTKSEGAYREIAPEHAAELEAQMSGARAAAEKRAQLRREEARLLEEIEKVRVGMERLGVRRNVLPMLDGIPAAAPCSVRWDEMSGNGDARTCGECKLTVVNVAMTDAAQAQALVSACGRDLHLHRRVDGTILARDCPTGVARRRFFSVAPLAILALMAVIAGVALYAASVPQPISRRPLPIPDLGQMTTPEERPPSLEPGQFGSPPPVSPPPTSSTRPLVLRGAPTLHVSDGFSGMLGHLDSTIDLTRQGPSFAAALTCSKNGASLSRRATIPAATVDAFLDAVASHALGAEEALCRHTDDYPSIQVTVGNVTLSVRNCSYQWHANGVALDDKAPAASPFESSHSDINAAYRAMLAAAGERACFDDVKNQPPKPVGVVGGCNPPYTLDASGHKHWKASCL